MHYLDQCLNTFHLIQKPLALSNLDIVDPETYVLKGSETTSKAEDQLHDKQWSSKEATKPFFPSAILEYNSSLRHI